MVFSYIGGYIYISNPGGSGRQEKCTESVPLCHKAAFQSALDGRSGWTEDKKYSRCHGSSQLRQAVPGHHRTGSSGGLCRDSETGWLCGSFPEGCERRQEERAGSDSGYPGRYLFSDYADYSGRRMVKVLLSILVLFELIDKTGNLYYFLRFIADASCYFLPVFLAAFAAGKSYQRDSGFRRPGCRRSRWNRQRETAVWKSFMRQFLFCYGMTG